MNERWLEEQIEDEWDRAEAEMLEQVNLATGERTVNLTQKPGWWRDTEEGKA